MPRFLKILSPTAPPSFTSRSSCAAALCAKFGSFTRDQSMFAKTVNRPGYFARTLRTCAASRSPDPPLRLFIVRMFIASICFTSDASSASDIVRF